MCLIQIETETEMEIKRRQDDGAGKCRQERELKREILFAFNLYFLLNEIFYKIYCIYIKHIL